MSGYSLNIGPSPADLDEDAVKARYSIPVEQGECPNCGDELCEECVQCERCERHEKHCGIAAEKNAAQDAADRLEEALAELQDKPFDMEVQREVYEARKALGED